MNSISLPWASWYGDYSIDLPVPSTWQVSIPRPVPVQPLTDDEMYAHLLNPIGSKRLADLAQGKRSVVIVIDDLSRPTPTKTLLPLILKELGNGGVDRSSIRILLGYGTHRPLTRIDLLKKIGTFVDEFEVINHNPYECLDYIGKTSAGTPVWISRFYVEADLRLTIGCVEPHPALGFSGGVKLVIPGLAGIETIYANHRDGPLKGGILFPDNNQKRRDFEEAAHMVGLDFIVNVVINGNREVVGLFAGDSIMAHRAASRFAEEVMAVPVGNFEDGLPDIAIFNAYPKDTELLQINNALNAARSAKFPLLHSKTVVILTTAASEGVGYHALVNPGGRMHIRPHLSILNDRPVFVFCPHGKISDIPASLPPSTQLFRNWEDIVQKASQLVDVPHPKVIVFTEGPLQIPVVQPPHVNQAKEVNWSI